MKKIIIKAPAPNPLRTVRVLSADSLRIVRVRFVRTEVAITEVVKSSIYDLCLP